MIVNQCLTRYQVLDSSLVNTVGFPDSLCDSPQSRFIFLLCNAHPSNLSVPPSWLLPILPFILGHHQPKHHSYQHTPSRVRCKHFSYTIENCRLVYVGLRERFPPYLGHQLDIISDSASMYQFSRESANCSEYPLLVHAPCFRSTIHIGWITWYGMGLAYALLILERGRRDRYYPCTSQQCRRACGGPL